MICYLKSVHGIPDFMKKKKYIVKSTILEHPVKVHPSSCNKQKIIAG
jgi:hypothetical protein